MRSSQEEHVHGHIEALKLRSALVRQEHREIEQRREETAPRVAT
jgi:hypothetical protein